MHTIFIKFSVSHFSFHPPCPWTTEASAQGLREGSVARDPGVNSDISIEELSLRCLLRA